MKKQIRLIFKIKYNLDTYQIIQQYCLLKWILAPGIVDCLRVFFV